MEDRTFVSIVMPIFNAESYLEEAIQSILHQTFSDFEFIIINDGSRDRSDIIIKNFVDKDQRIRYIDLGKNTGLSNVLNVGLREAKGKYIVRMDGDDIATPSRIQRQVEFMERHTDVGVCGSLSQIIGGKVMNQYMSSTMLEASLLLDNVLVHPTVIMRKSIVDTHELCYDGFVEDYRLWVKFSKVSKLAVVPEILLHYRLSEGQFSVRCKPEQSIDANRVRQMLFEEIINRPLTEIEVGIISKDVKYQISIDQVMEFTNIVLKNNKRYGVKEINYVLKKILFRHVYRSRKTFFDWVRILFCSFLTLQEKLSLLSKIRFT